LSSTAELKLAKSRAIQRQSAARSSQRLQPVDCLSCLSSGSASVCVRHVCRAAQMVSANKAANKFCNNSRSARNRTFVPAFCFVSFSCRLSLWLVGSWELPSFCELSESQAHNTAQSWAKVCITWLASSCCSASCSEAKLNSNYLHQAYSFLSLFSSLILPSSFAPSNWAQSSCPTFALAQTGGRVA